MTGRGVIIERSKRHHYLPECYLRRWASDRDQVQLLRRDTNGKMLTPNVKNVGVESNLYTSEIGGVADDYIEKELSKLEGSLPPLLNMIANGDIPLAESRERQGLSLLMAIQRARTPEVIQWLTLPRRFLAFCGNSSPDLDQMRVFLSTKHLGFEPAEREVKAALDWLTGILNTHPAIADLKNHEIVLHTLRATVEHVAPLLQQMRWNIGTCRKSCFLTSDRPLTLWCAAEPIGMGVGVQTADEIWFPVDPKHVLILRTQGWDGVEQVKPAGPIECLSISRAMLTRSSWDPPTSRSSWSA